MFSVSFAFSVGVGSLNHECDSRPSRFAGVTCELQGRALLVFSFPDMANHKSTTSREMKPEREDRIYWTHK